MNKERIEDVAKAVEAYGDTVTLFAMTPNAAAEALNKQGGDFTTDDLIAFGDAVRMVANNVSSNGELNEESLSQVSGGFVITYGTCFVAGCLLGWGLGGLVFGR